MEIANSLQFAKVEILLLGSISKIKNYLHQKEAKKIVDNIRLMVVQLSKLELEARRSSSHSARRVEEQLHKVNKEITELEKWIMLLVLSA